MNLKLKTLIESYRERLEAKLAYHLPLSSTAPQELHQAMRYSSVDAGKRIRPFLVYATGLATNVSADMLDSAAIAVELIHCYSLVHDDMPAMDNDDLRRGKKTCHLQFSEATALLTGDALQTLAFEVLSHSPLIEAKQAIQLVQLLAKASGSAGMAGGQAIDLASVGKKLNLAQLQTMHAMKTGALIQVSVQMPCVLAQISDEKKQNLSDYAQHIGLAFQIHDDVLDIDGDTQTLGKPQGSDQLQDKPTYPEIVGLENAKELALEHKELAINALRNFDSQADPLRWLADYVVLRNK